MSRLMPLALACALTACSGAAAPLERERTADGISISGVVTDQHGVAVPNIVVTASTDACIPARTGRDGRFTIRAVAPGSLRLITYGDTVEGQVVGSLSVALVAHADAVLESAVVSPRLGRGAAVDLDARSVQVLEPMPGMELRVAPGSLRLAPFAAPSVAAVAIPLERAPAFVPAGVELAALFYLHPIRSRFTAPASVTFPAVPGWEVGQAFEVYGLDYGTGLLRKVAHGRVAEDGRPVTDPGSGVRELTWYGLVAAQEQ